MGLITKSYTFTNGVGNNVDATQINKDFDDLYTLVNGNLEAVNMKDGIITLLKLAAEVKVIESVTHTILTASYTVTATETAIITQNITLSAQRYCLFLIKGICRVVGFVAGTQVSVLNVRTYDGTTMLDKIFVQSPKNNELGATFSGMKYKQLTSGAHTIYVKALIGTETGEAADIYGDADGVSTYLTTIVFAF